MIEKMNSSLSHANLTPLNKGKNKKHNQQKDDQQSSQHKKKYDLKKIEELIKKCQHKLLQKNYYIDLHVDSSSIFIKELPDHQVIKKMTYAQFENFYLRDVSQVNLYSPLGHKVSTN